MSEGDEQAEEVDDDPTTDRVLVSDGLALLLLSLAPLRRGPARGGASFPDGGAALLVIEALRRQGASESWLRDVGIGLKTLARVMIHHQPVDVDGDMPPPEKVGWSRCASSVHLLGTAMAFEESGPVPGPHAGPALPLSLDIATAVAQQISSESVNRVISVLELAYGMAHRIPAGTHYSAESVVYARRVRECLEARERAVAARPVD